MAGSPRVGLTFPACRNMMVAFPAIIGSSTGAAPSGWKSNPGFSFKRTGRMVATFTDQSQDVCVCECVGGWVWVWVLGVLGSTYLVTGMSLPGALAGKLPRRPSEQYSKDCARHLRSCGESRPGLGTHLLTFQRNP